MSDEPRPKLLEVKNLRTYFDVEGRTAKAIDGVSFHIFANEVFGLVGESGSGKSVASLSIMRLIPNPPGRIEGGEILFRGKDLLKLPHAEMRKIRGNEISMIFQEPMTALNPVFTIGFQLREAIRHHQPQMTKHRRTTAPSRCSSSSASPTRRAASRTTRTSSPAACGSAP